MTTTSVQGTLHTYSPGLTCFEFGSSNDDDKASREKVVLFVGGLTDGYLSTPYLPALAKSLEEQGWALVQVHLSSSYLGYGTGSLDTDVDELHKWVREERR